MTQPVGPQPKVKHSKLSLGVGVAGLALALYGCSTLNLARDVDGRLASLPVPTVTVTETAGSEPTQPESAPTPIQKLHSDEVITDGTYEVGVDVKPGTYTTGGPPEGSSGCYRKHLKTLDDDGLIYVDITKGPTTVVVKSPIKFMTFSGGCEWSRKK
ncbi:hypothetical protein [Sphaerisporangium perillae]|uniref:hypothetical protein n=1 Tax=Sphaerisporangium perillae TaxID=2935860 RepID=UPI00200F9678|nr:hypothetical protein [Sphaerisporangium perillae]